jgi:hypothetical protein
MSGPVAAVVDPIVDVVDPYVRRATSALFSPRTQSIIVKLIVALVAFTAMVGAAVIAYAGFYYFYIPKVEHTAPVYLQYDGENAPWARVDFTDISNRQFLAYDQGYDVSMDLVLPSSDRNYDIGNFMVRVDLASNDGKIIHSSSRPAILTYQSPLLRLMNTLARSLLLITGWSREAEALTLPLMEGVTDSYDSPITHAIITVSSPKLMIYEARLHLRAQFKGLRYLMYYWSFSTGIVFVGTFVLWSLLFAAIAWRSLAQWWNTRAAHAYETALAFGEDDQTLQQSISPTMTSVPSDLYASELETSSYPASHHPHLQPGDEQLVPEISDMSHYEDRSPYDTLDETADDTDKGGESSTAAGLRRRPLHTE